jgi:hypothetical protein
VASRWVVGTLDRFAWLDLGAVPSQRRRPIDTNELSISSLSDTGLPRSKAAGRLEMSKYTAEYWKDRADEARAIRDNMTGGVPRRIMAEIAADYDRLYHWTLNRSGPMQRQQAIDVLISSPFSAAQHRKANMSASRRRRSVSQTAKALGIDIPPADEMIE